jgi:hypothetical protein
MTTTHVRHTLLVLGVLVMVLGALDLFARMSTLEIDPELLRTAFAPAATLP